MKLSQYVSAIIIMSTILLAHCKSPTSSMTKEQKIKKEIALIDSLLQDKHYTEEMAESLYNAYYSGIGKTAPPFITKGDDTTIIQKSIREQRIAINIAGFYALECGLGYLYEHSNLTSSEWLKRIVNDTANDSVVFLMNRFANATWKAGQPFRDINRITKDNFVSASSLPPEEVAKDHIQIVNAAKKLLLFIDVSSKEEEMLQLQSLLHDTAFAIQMASHIDSSYSVSVSQPYKPEKNGPQSKQFEQRTLRDEKIAPILPAFMPWNVQQIILLQRNTSGLQKYFNLSWIVLCQKTRGLCSHALQMPHGKPASHLGGLKELHGKPLNHFIS